MPVNADRFPADIHESMRTTSPRRRRSLAVTFVTIVLGVSTLIPVAGATVLRAPRLEITGTPTTAETAIIRGTWLHFAGTFERSSSCMGPITVAVVDRAEDHFDRSGIAIAAFYRRADATVYVEHGKVTPAVLAHEFAHHLDVGCGLAETSFADDFTLAARLDPAAPWHTGPSWNRVPAEHFGEAVLAWLEIGPLEIDVSQAAIDLIQLVVWLGADGYDSGPSPLPPLELG